MSSLLKYNTINPINTTYIYEMDGSIDGRIDKQNNTNNLLKENHIAITGLNYDATSEEEESLK